MRQHQQGMTPRAAIEQAVAHHHAGDLERAYELYRKILVRDPANPDLLQLLAIVSHQTGRGRDAIKHLTRAVALRPESPEMRCNLGNLFLAAGRLEEAVAEYEKAVALRPEFAEAHSNMALALQDLGRVDEAVEHLAKALVLNPDSAPMHNNLGVVYKKQGKLAEAQACFEKAAAIKPSYADALANLGNVLRARGLASEAAARCEKAVALAPHSSAVRLAMADTLAAQGRLDEAAAQYKAAIGLEPGLAEAYLGLAGVLDQQGIAEEALGFVDKALTLKPDLPQAQRAFAALLKYAASTSYQPDLERALVRSFASPDVDRQDLARVTAGQLKHKYGMTREESLVPAGALDRRLVDKLASDRLFLAFLEKAVNSEPAVEFFLARLRRALLLAHRGGDRVPKASLRLISAIAQQCFNNEYVFATEAGEDAEVARLRAEIEAAIGSSKGKVAGIDPTLLLLGMYAPLSELSCARDLARVALDQWAPDLRPVVQRTLLDPLEEIEIAEAIPSLAKVSDATSRAVQSQYEENPYPRWISLPREQPGNYAEILRCTFPHFSPPAFLSGPIQVLVAGCGTGQHPIRAALTYQNANVVAVDLSRQSLAYAKRMADRLGVQNIEFLQADILDLAGLDRRFHVIECAGVLHHMEDPLRGWRVLSDLLLADGTMEVGLYSEKARRNVVRARERIAEIGLAPTRADIRRFRTKLLMGGNEAELTSLLDFEDFFSMSGCRDFLFNVQEHRFTLPRIKQALDDLGLRFIGFMIPNRRVAREYKARFPHDRDMTDLGAWDRFEDAMPDAFCEMYQFLCQKGRDG